MRYRAVVFQAFQRFASGGPKCSVSPRIMNDSALLDAIPTEQRLALAYARPADKPLMLALFLLDTRLAATVRGGREPVLAQIKLAWWREQLGKDAGDRPAGEPLLALLAPLAAQGAALARLVDGWEQLLGESPLGSEALAGFADGRGAAFAALARHLGEPAAAPEAERAARGWALADLTAKLGHAEERATAQDLARRHDWRRPALSRRLRPLAVLHGLAARGRGQGPLLDGPGALFTATRVGLLGL